MNKFIPISTILLFLVTNSTVAFAADADSHITQSAQEIPASTIKEPLGLPPIPWPEDNKYSKEKTELGRYLYFDKRLSSNETVSCATCHHFSCGFSDCKVIAVGIDERKGSRHTPTVINGAYLKLLFWDGRASSLEEQCKGPIANTKEMTKIENAHQSHQQCEDRIKNVAGYKPLFKKAFGTEEINIDLIAKAVATFERTILSGNSAYDRYKAGDKSALTAEQIRGYELFQKVGCAICHSGPNFTDGRFMNIGVGMDAPEPDTGRFGISKIKGDWGAFKTPTLREVSHTAPYMHDGSLKTLTEVIEYYDKGGIPNKNLHPLMKPLKLSESDKLALVSFLESLDGEGWQHFVEPDSFPQ